MLLLSAADSAGLPVVSGVDALLIAVSAKEPHLAYQSALLAIAGSLAGSLILFGIARKGGELFLTGRVQKGLGRYLHAWFQRYGLATVFVPAMSPLPLPLKIPVFCAGALGVRWTSFIGVVIVARSIRYFALAYLAQRYGSTTLTFLKTHWGAVTAVAISLAAAILVILRLSQRRFRD